MAAVFVKGRVALITGGAGGIGLAVAHACGRRGMRVAIADLNPEALESARCSLVEEFGAQSVLAQRCDVADEGSVLELRDVVLGRWGDVAFLHLNAGVGGGSGPQDTPHAAWERVIGVNLYGVAHGVRAFVPGMKACGRPCAVAATASWAGLFNAATFSGVPYVASKAGAVLLMESLAHELRREKGCRVTAHVLCPGRVETGMLRGEDEHREPIYVRRLEKIADPEQRARQEAAFKRQEKERVAGAMSPEEMAAVLLAAVEEGRFYVLGWDDHQPLEVLKLLATLRTEDVVQERPPLSHRTPDGGEARRRLKEAMDRGRKRVSRL